MGTKACWQVEPDHSSALFRLTLSAGVGKAMKGDLTPALPIDAIAAPLADALGRGGNAVVLAAPGAGKSTRIPLLLREAPWLSGEILMLEPRRLAARAAAARMAATLGEQVGATVGYRIQIGRAHV